MTTVVPAVALIGLGWALIRQDRSQEGQARLANRERAAELAAAALTRTLTALEDRLTEFAAGRYVAPETPEELSLTAFGPAGLITRGAAPLPFYPGSPPAFDPPEAITRADVLELRDHNDAAALRLLEPVRSDENLSIRGEALLRIARLERKQGRVSASLDAFDRLAALDQTVVDGQPAGLVGAQGRGLILDADQKRGELSNVAASLLRDLRAGRWPLSRVTYEFASEQAREWLRETEAQPPDASSDADRLALADAVGKAWDDWRQNPSSAAPSARIPTWIDGQSVLVLTRATVDRLVVEDVSPRYLDTHWRRSAIDSTFGLALSDPSGHAVVGDTSLPPQSQSLRTASETMLPWTVHAVDGRAPSRTLSRQATVMLGALGVMLCLVLAGGHIIVRALTRELRVGRLQSEFVSAVSHEFRTPLTTVRHLSELLARGRVASEPRRAEFYGILVRESDRLQRLVENLLDFARVESGDVAYRFEALAPGPFVREVVDDFRGERAGMGTRVSLDGDDASLPTIRADRDMLARVFWNLLDNAVKYSGGPPDVRIEMAAAETRLVVRVRDRGMGIPPGEQSRVFDKFVRGDAARAASIKGTGIGLAMSREIVRAHGGEITVESEIGSGSTFEVSLPGTTDARDPELNRWQRAS